MNYQSFGVNFFRRNFFRRMFFGGFVFWAEIFGRPSYHNSFLGPPGKNGNRNLSTTRTWHNQEKGSKGALRAALLLAAGHVCADLALCRVRLHPLE